jgi:hypothetical protein
MVEVTIDTGRGMLTLRESMAPSQISQLAGS